MLITRSRLHSALRSALVAVSTDPTREDLNGVAIYLRDEYPHLQLVATNGALLIEVRPELRCDTASPSGYVLGTERRGWIGTVPTTMVKQATSLLRCTRKSQQDDEVSLVVDDDSNELRLLVPNVGGSSSSLGELREFPPYEQVTPPRPETKRHQVPSLVGWSPLHLMNLGRAAGEFLGEAHDWKAHDSAVPLRVTYPRGALDPLRADLEHPRAGRFMGVLMPVRLP